MRAIKVCSLIIGIAIISFDQQLRDHTGKKPKYQLVLQKVMRAAPRFFWCALAWHL